MKKSLPIHDYMILAKGIFTFQAIKKGQKNFPFHVCMS